MLVKSEASGIFARVVADPGMIRFSPVANHSFTDVQLDAMKLSRNRLTAWGESYSIDSKATVVR